MNRYFFTLRWLLICWIAGYVAHDAHSAGLDNAKAIAPPPMACNDLVHISLDTICKATVAPHMLLEDMIGSPVDYRIKLYYPNGSEQPDLDLDRSDVNKKYDYKIWHLPSGNSCWGKILVEDKYAPEILCRNFSIRCSMGTTPGLLGFPIPSAYTYLIHIDSISPTDYLVDGWDACGLVKLSFKDYVYNNQCDLLCFRKIVREWTAIDEVGNTSKCADTICVLRPTEADIVYPHHYDGFDLPHLSCDLDFPKLANGNPSPDYTGWPVPVGCSTLTASYTDLKILTCGVTFKIIRRWIILNWCTGQLTEYNQIIKVADDRAPILGKLKDITIGMQLYLCQSEGFLPKPDSVIDCNAWTYDVFSMEKDPITDLPYAPSKSFIFYDAGKDLYILRGAPEGKNWIIYVVTDACGNIAQDTIEVGVVDNLAPIPVCDQKTVVTLGIDGTAKAYAETFDDHSLDNCGIDSFLVRRMDDTCHTGTNVFGPFVSFCCADVGRTLMVALEVVDYYGNRNTCMIEVTVQDKEPPVIIPPTDITVSCTFPIDFSNLSNFGFVRLNEADRKRIIIADPLYAFSNFIAGKDGIATDNCDFTISEYFEKDIQCNIGTIRRIFVAVDGQGLIDTAIQTITIINTDPFDSLDIIWPNNVEIYSCNNVVTHPDQTGHPQYNNRTCAQIAANYDDTKLTVLDSTCYKILRKWFVIDWCQYDRNTNKGYWEHTQIIAVKNSEPPVISSCTDVDLCDQNAFHNPNTGQCMATFVLNGAGTDDCTEIPNLIWNYRVDENNDGSFGPVQNGNVATGVLPVGVHRLRWILTDQCGNISTCDQVFNLKDCKKPTPYCHNGVVTVIMPIAGTVTVWAKDLNLNSFDNCTAAQDLKFSFSPDVNDVYITYNCDSLNRQKVITKTVRIYVTDEYGNQDYCETTIRIQDNNNVCPGTNPGFNLSGKINRENNDAIPGTSVNLNDPNGVVLDQTQTDAQGNYAFQNILVSNFYLKPNKADAINNGVSTLDLVLIQRHILGIKSFNSPYKLLAADVNNSNSVTAKDVSDLRKVILGINVQFPNQTPVWKFMKADYQFTNPQQPWDAPSRIESIQLQEKLDQAHFLGIKTGDVDLSASVSLNNSVFNRNNNDIQWTFKNAFVNSENEVQIDIQSGADLYLDGFQVAMELNSKSLSIKTVKSATLEIHADDFVVDGKQIKMSCALANRKFVKSGEVLFSIVLEGSIANVDKIGPLHTLESYSNEAYSNEKANTLFIRNEQEHENAMAKLQVYPIQPNPFSKEATIRFEMPESGLVNLQVYDLTGKRVFSTEQNGVKGKNEMILNRKDLGKDGLMYYVLTTPFGSVSERMFMSE